MLNLQGGEFDDFSCWEDTMEVSSPSENNELEIYRNMIVAIDKEDDVLNWWQAHAARLPRLSSLACRMFATPATSAPSERSFSAAGRV